MGESIISNPFVGCTARDMKFEEVRQYWCSPFELYSLNESELFTSRTPIVIEGARGTGKTMILKYLSYFVQRDFIKDMTIEGKLAFFKERSLGIYFRYKFDFCNMFGQLDCDEQDKKIIFKNYYELFIIRQIVEVLEDFYQGQDTSQVEKVLSDFFKIEICSLNEIHQNINLHLRNLDEAINAVNYDRNWNDKIMRLVSSESMLPELVRTINQYVSGWKDIVFVILLDEYENLGIFQRDINTLIKQVDDTANLTYRLGMRPAGMDNDNQTNVADEKLQIDRDFLLRRLEYKNIKDYKAFALDISRKRLSSVSVYKENHLIDINLFLGKKEDFDAEAEKVAKSRKHFKLLKKYFQEDEMNNVINELSCDEKLMEMYNILRVSRGEDYKRTGNLCRQYQKLRKERNLKNAENELYKYHLDYSNKYRVTLLYMLLTIYGEHKQYYSVNTFLRLSSGSINDFISLCRNVFKHMNQQMLEDIKNGKTIDSKIQTYAAIDTAEDQRRKVSMSNKFGREMYNFIDSMGGIFEFYHRDLEARYPETNQFAFDDENQLRNDDELNAYFVELINSGAIIRKPKRQRKSLGKERGNIYQLNRIYAPIYQYSYRTRGGFNQIISLADFKDMLKKTVDPQMFVCKNESLEQYELFDTMGVDEDETTDL